MKSSLSIEIDASPERVFCWLEDAERVMQWVPNIVENENLEVTEEKVGSTFRQVYVENGRRMEMFGLITEYEPNRQWNLEIDGSGFKLFLEYRLEDLGGRTRLTQDTDIQFKGLFKIIGLIMAPLLRKSSRKQHEDSFQKLKNLAESEVEQPTES